MANGTPARPWFRTEVVLLAAGLLTLVYLLGDVLLLIFAAGLLAVGLDGLASVLARRTPLGRGWALALVSLLILIALAAAVGLAAPQFWAQLGELQENLTDFADQASSWLTGIGASEVLDEMNGNGEQLAGAAQDVLGYLATWGMTTLGALTSLIIFVVIGLFSAADPRLYRNGFLHLFPQEKRDLLDETLSATAYALRWWFLGQLVSMAMLGVTVAVGLFLIGVEIWLALAVVTALLTFVPFLGPLLAAIPIVIVGFAEGVETGIIVAIGYLVIQNVEGNVVTPMIQHKAVNLAPALLIAVQLILGTAFGALGLILAAPLTVVGMVWVKKLWVGAALGDRKGAEL
jgi:predicted PurR-regulated permease PerM